MRTVAQKLAPEFLRRIVRRRRAWSSIIRGFGTWGYERSTEEGAPVDANGQPLPWYTYPAIAYLKGINTRALSVLEWGCGFSTLFWAQRAESVLSIEHDPSWAQSISSRVGGLNVRIQVERDLECYVNAPLGRQFDVVVIDGLRRRACARHVPSLLAADGFVILDNSDWLPSTCEVLRTAGLLQVDFHGFGPLNDYPWCTSVFFGRDAAPRPESRQPFRDPLSLDRCWDDDPVFGD